MFKSLKRSRIVAIADVGATSAGVAIIALEKNLPAKILVSAHEHLPVGSRTTEQAGAQVLEKLAGASESVLKAYTAQAGENARPMECVYAFIHAPWTKSATLSAVSKFPQETRVNDHTIADVAREILPQHAQSEKSNIIEASIVRVELNGYATAKPIGKYAHVVSATVFINECDATMQSGIENVLSRTFLQKPRLRSSVGALVVVLREIASLPEEFLVVDMSSDATTLITLLKGVAYDTKIVSEGVGSIVQRLAGEKMPEEILPLIRLATIDQCEESACKAIKTALANIEPELVHTFGDAIGQLALRRRLPNSVIIVVQTDIAPWLVHFFSRIDFTQFTSTTRPFVPTVLTNDDLKGHVTYDDAHVPDTALSIATALVNIEQAVH